MNVSDTSQQRAVGLNRDGRVRAIGLGGKKHLRRTAGEIDRTYVCPYDGCSKFFGSEGSQNLHIKIKHNGGSKTDREKLARTLVQAYASNSISDEIIDSVDLNLPPGVITKIAQKAGLLDKINEV